MTEHGRHVKWKEVFGKGSVEKRIGMIEEEGGGGISEDSRDKERQSEMCGKLNEEKRKYGTDTGQEGAR